jgi:hypothetical protein
MKYKRHIADVINITTQLLTYRRNKLPSLLLSPHTGRM